MELSNQPIKGTSDWYGAEFLIRQYIFNTWVQVNNQFGYQQYLTPLLEPADIYRAKSGDDIAGPELMTMIDRGGRELAIRPEMTPSVTRLVTHMYSQTPKPIRLFSIANFLRNEKPQRGRNREFWQLNTDIFADESIQSDLEILQIALEIMTAFKAPPESITLKLNHRQLINQIISAIAPENTENKVQIIRLLDKYNKLPTQVFNEKLIELGIQASHCDYIHQILQVKNLQELQKVIPNIESHLACNWLTQIINTLHELQYPYTIEFSPSMIRGFDYYDGMVFEVFDNHPDNKRSMFGGGRYNGLANLFGNYNIPAVGFAPGDETTKLFLQSWDLLPKDIAQSQTIFLPFLADELFIPTMKLANQLRSANLKVQTSTHPFTISQALTYANKQQFPWVVIFGTQEQTNQTITIKNMNTGQQVTQDLSSSLLSFKHSLVKN